MNTASHGGAPALVDVHGRTLRDLRISLTDRCNLRCVYCLPETEAARDFHPGCGAPASDSVEPAWMPSGSLLTFDELERVARLVVPMGLRKIRLTGGEPLLRQGVEELVARLARVPGITDLAMTTNGFLFPRKAAALRAAGLRRVSFSLDSLDRENFKRIAGRDGLREVLESIALARDLGFHPVKLNTVIIRGLNDHELEDLARFAHDQALNLRFIELMLLASARAGWRQKVVPGREMLARLAPRFSLRPIEPDSPAATARRYAFADGRGELGIITPVSEPFCGQCNRVRLTADGKIRTCLFSVAEHDLRAQLRAGATDPQLGEWLRRAVWEKEERHHLGEPAFEPPSRTMSGIGG